MAAGKGNPNPSPATRFGPGNNGRPKATRDKISRAFLEAVADDFDKHGKKTLETVRKDDPSTYIKVVAALLPKEIEITRPLDGVTDDELAAAIEYIRANLPKPEHTVN